MRLDSLPERVTVYEVGPRDGLQNESSHVSTDEKVAFVEALADAGLPCVEMTSFVSAKWIPQLADHEEIARRVRRREGTRYSALVPNRRGLEAALAASLREIAVFLSASEMHNKRNVNKTIGETLRVFEDIVPAARREGLRVRAYVSTVWYCPYAGRVDPRASRDLARALVDMGCDEVSLGDTVGVATPREVERALGVILERVPVDKVALHFHDTRGTALANILVGLTMGVTTVDAAAGGLGGCPYAPGAAGNVATEDVVHMLHGMGIETGVNLEALVDVSEGMQKVIGHDFPSKVLRATLGVRERARREASH